MWLTYDGAGWWLWFGGIPTQGMCEGDASLYARFTGEKAVEIPHPTGWVVPECGTGCWPVELRSKETIK